LSVSAVLCTDGQQEPTVIQCLGSTLHRRTARTNGYSMSRQYLAPTDSKNQRLFNVSAVLCTDGQQEPTVIQCLGGALHRRTARTNGYSMSRRCFAPTDSKNQRLFNVSAVPCTDGVLSPFSTCSTFDKFANIHSTE